MNSRIPTVAAQKLSNPVAWLSRAPTLRLPGVVDSNSPAVWDLLDGRTMLSIMTSVNGQPSVAEGPSLNQMEPAAPVSFINHPGDGVWMEDVIVDEVGTWYGYYHNEVPATACNRPDRALPRIGAARSRDHGHTWENLGIVLEAPPGWEQCHSPNRYFVGGVGDVGTMLDHDGTTLYFFFSQYSRFPAGQGVAVGRLLWADRDAPVGRMEVWVNGIWQPAQRIVTDEGDDVGSWIFPAGTPLVPVTRPWHDADPVNDAFWGASLHWNTFLELYVMLLNRAKDESFGQEGIYVSYAPTLDNPALWSVPVRILKGGQWYPQVMGLEQDQGTDKEAGRRARFFMSGSSTYFIDFGTY